METGAGIRQKSAHKRTFTSRVPCRRLPHRRITVVIRKYSAADGRCQEILMVETTQHGVRAHGNILAQAMSESGIEVMMRCRRRIRDTGTQGHMWARRIVMGNPRFQNRP